MAHGIFKPRKNSFDQDEGPRGRKDVKQGKQERRVHEIAQLDRDRVVEDHRTAFDSRMGSNRYN